MKKLVSLLLVLSMLFSLALADEERVKLMTFGGIPVYLDDVQTYTSILYNNGYISSETDYLAGLEYILRYDAGMKLLIPDPSAYLTSEEIAETTESAGTYYDECVKGYVDSKAAEGATEDERAILALEASEAFGITRDDYLSQAVVQAAFAKLLESYDATVTEEEIAEAYAIEVEYEQSNVPNVAMYEYYTNYYGYSFCFMPEGYRGITHILLKADDELCSAYSAAEAGEAKTAAAAAIIASKQETIDAIYAALATGTSFEELIAQYGEDPGMQNADYLAEGYSVHADSITFMEEFTAGAFSDKMVNVGDVSDPVVTSYGVHILYYLRDIPGGALPMSDDMREEIKSYLVSSKQGDCLDANLKNFEATYTDAYAEYIGTENFLSK